MVHSQRTSVRLVLNPERMVVKEAQRTYLYLNLFQYPCDMAICNRVIPPTVTDPYFAAWKETQARHLDLAHEAFSPLPLKQVPLFDDQVVGRAALERMAEALYGPVGAGSEDPARVYFRGKAHSVEREGEGYRLTIVVPSAARGDVALRKVGDELFVRAGPYRRSLLLPRALVGLEPRGARLEAGALHVSFAAPVVAARRV